VGVAAGTKWHGYAERQEKHARWERGVGRKEVGQLDYFGKVPERGGGEKLSEPDVAHRLNERDFVNDSGGNTGARKSF